MYAAVANQSEIYLDAGFSVVLNYVWDIDYFKIFLGKFANQKNRYGATLSTYLYLKSSFLRAMTENGLSANSELRCIMTDSLKSRGVI